MSEESEDEDIKKELKEKEQSDQFTTAKRFLSDPTDKLVCQSCGMSLYRQSNVCRACGEKDESGIGVSKEEKK